MDQWHSERTYGRPAQQVTEYVRLKRFELGESIQKVKKVYLDTRYWILLRDVRLGRALSGEVEQLYQIIERLVTDGEVVCPFNLDIFLEFLKQTDPETIEASFKLVDDFCNGVSLLPSQQRLELEILHFVESTRSGKAIHPLDVLVWTRPAYFMGFVTPDFAGLAESDNLRLQVSFADFVWSMRMQDWVRIVGPEEIASWEPPFEDPSSELNRGKEEYKNSHKSFKSLLMEEIAGLLDYYKPRMSEMFQYLYERDTGKTVCPEEAENDESGRYLANLIYHAFSRNRIKKQMPTIRIGASLHAAVRWDRQRKYHANDVRDFHHAAAALPYCDLFLTEHSLCHLVHNQNLRFQKLYDCKTAAAVSDALSAVSSIAGQKR